MAIDLGLFLFFYFFIRFTYKMGILVYGFKGISGEKVR